jgi:formylglycine-generating enzyme required for sulfatase activity
MSLRVICRIAPAAFVALACLASARGQSCGADLNGDGQVNGTDLSVILAGWGPCVSGPDCNGDINGDGSVNGTDLTALLAGWGECVTETPAWATVIDAQPDPQVVRDAKLRAAISSTGYSWRVRDSVTQMEMVLIPPGVFDMGCSPSQQSQCATDESPVHEVRITEPFYLGRYEVTQSLWTAVMGSNPSNFQNASTQVPADQVPNRPVDQISWDTVQGFLSATGSRLPTEAQWEYAYRAGTTTAFHSTPAQTGGTNDDTFLGDIAWYVSNSQNQTRPVGQKPGNGFGLHDMAGNVAEWVRDRYSATYYASSPSSDPQGPTTGSSYVVRGGSWSSSPPACRSSSRASASWSSGSSARGFRAAKRFDAPFIAGVTPSSGLTTGGTPFTIVGANLGGTTQVRVGGTLATNVQVIDSTRVQAVAPTGPVGAASVQVVTPSGTVSSAGVFTFIPPPPSLSQVTPSELPIGGGTTLVVIGTNFEGPVSVSVGGAAATNVQISTPTVLTAVAPAGMAGPKVVSVTTLGGTATLPNAVAYVTSVRPAWATIVESGADPAVVVDPALRAAIAATGYPWRIRDTATQIELVLIPPGTFQMGCSPSSQWSCYTDEVPVHSVSLSQPFYLGRCEVTQGEWLARMGSNPSQFQGASYPDAASRPVEQVSFSNVQSFVSATGMRLPTEAEWEYACRAGTATAFHGFSGQPNGTSADGLLGSIAWFSASAGGQTRPVGQKLPNGFGLHDMSGNVWEWVNDWYAATYYSASPSTNPQGPSTGSVRVVRGGSWASNSDDCRSSRRSSASSAGGNVVGLRVARFPNAPTLVAVSPSAGPTGGGTTITLSGQNLANATSVRIGSSAATTLRPVNATSLSAVTPSGSSGTRDVVVVTPQGSFTLHGAFTYVAPPTVASISPTTGSTLGGTAVTLTGTNLSTASAVRFGSLPAAAFEVVSPTTIVATTPPSPAGAVAISVTTVGGTASATSQFTFVSPPTLASASPASGPVTGGTAIVLSGSNLNGTTSVAVGGIPAASFQVLGANAVAVVVPAAPAGLKSISLSTPYGTAALPNAFEHVEGFAPQWSAPIEVQPNPGVVTDPALRAAIVATGYAWRVRDSATQMELVLVPPGTFQMGCSASIQATCASNESPVHAINLTEAIYVGRNEVTQEQWVSQMGTNPSQFTGVNYPNWPTRPVERVSWNSVQGFLGATGTRLPTEAEWEYAYRAGTATAFHGFEAFLAGTNENALLVNIAWFGGQSLTETRPVGQKLPNGFGLYDMSGNVSEWVNDWYSATYYSTSPSTNPQGPSTGSVRVVRGGGWPDAAGSCRSSFRAGVSPGSSANSRGFRVVRSAAPAPALASVIPVNGPMAGGTTITIRGANLQSVQSVRVGGTLATGIQVLDERTITAVTPAGTVGPADVRVLTAGGTGTLSSSFTYVVEPTVSSVAPASGPVAGGTTITLAGTNLVGTTSVTVGGAAATNVQVVSATTVTAVTPAGTLGARDVVLMTPGGTATRAGGFTYVPAPTLTSVSPASGPIAGGTTITLTGTNLTGTTSVTVGGAAATNVQVVSATTVTAVTPAGTAGARNVTVTTPGGSATRTGGFTYAIVTVPSWATLIEAAPDSNVVTSATLRSAIAATGYAWLVRDTATQIDMVLIPPGTFQMGCSPSNQWGCGLRENPVHSVTLTQPFYLGRYEVTQAQWTARMGSNPSEFQGATAQVPADQVPSRPVDSLSWNMIQGFLGVTGMRLPTEAEWEYAYRAGTTTAFHGSTGQPAGTNDDALLGSIAWFGSNSGSQTRPVGQKAGNGFGLHDMSGNVWEWVNDWYLLNYYVSSPSVNPPGPSSGLYRVLRGGSWFDSSGNCRSSYREYDSPSGVWFGGGFRVARTP